MTDSEAHPPPSMFEFGLEPADGDEVAPEFGSDSVSDSKSEPVLEADSEVAPEGVPVDAANDVAVPAADDAAVPAADDVDPWRVVVGQSRAVAALNAAVAAPLHAYLLVGPQGSGKRSAAAVFAGELIVAADHQAASDNARAGRHRRLAAREEHPDVFVLDPAGSSLRVEDIESLLLEAARTPVETNRKVLVVERFHTATAEAAAALLKPVEEPTGSLVWVVLAEQVLPEHVTIASRCVRVDFGAVPEADIAAVLVAEGLASEQRALQVAAICAGNLTRARILAVDERVMTRREAWWSVPDRLDGSGAAVAILSAELRALIDEAAETLKKRHLQEAEKLAADEAEHGVRGSGRAAVEAQHKREQRQFRNDEIRFGLATLAARYREQIRSSSTSNPPEASSQIESSQTEAAMSAISRLRITAENLIRSPNESLALQSLLLDLPPTPPDDPQRNTPTRAAS